MSRQLPFADAATIRAHQKDAYFESSYRSQLQDILQFIKGQRFVNSYPQEITILAKAIYLSLTTLLGARTLGEEYVDLIYVNRTGKRLPKLLPRLGFILSYALAPYIINKIVKKLKNKEGSWVSEVLTNYYKVLDTILNLHVALFYFQGEFYSLSKRFFGLRYAFGHHKEPEQMQGRNYSLLGAVIVLQFVVKTLMGLKTSDTKVADEETDDTKIKSINQLSQLSENYSNEFIVDLSDDKQLPYLPESSRDCMLCLSPMVNPSAANCGHLFCWDCIVDWIREHPECPLCRQQCLEQHLLPLK
ncbi:Peroxisome assembly protein, putative [Candida maltosa Xu316]|uniref:RING-type E3 ubiquitin transferase n=1 Tax=Candida maltosa (strain Xu316) TaxID=1245528 RepID=M3J618_CANMX|nr:Peroxisome assembly protein, putative [Candida maltosa Xu316]